MIKTSYGSFDGNTWETFCQQCLKLKYQDDGYQELVAWHGDLGIEGFTRTGLVFQCYCPNDDYAPKSFYEKQRNKITTDLNKLETKKKELKEYLKETKIIKWIFLTPKIPNKELIKHCRDKAIEFRNKKSEILSDNFDVLAWDEDFFLGEAPIVLGTNGNRVEINSDDPVDSINWKSENNELVNHAIEKHGKLLSDVKNKDSKVNDLTNITVEDYTKGLPIISKWKELIPTDYEKFMKIVSDYEDTVVSMCIRNKSDNNILYDNIIKELKTKLQENFGHLDSLAIDKITKYVVADWILRCPINFE